MASELLEGLNPEQKKAVLHTEGPMLVIAGAGTGKTRVITHRIAHLVMSGQAKPTEIVALTFTDKSAEEMLNRVDELLPLGYESIQVSTFHKFCDRLLRESGLDIGLNTDFRVLSKAEQWMLIKQNFFKLDLKYFRPLGNPYRFIDAMLTHISRVKDELVTPEMYRAWADRQADPLNPPWQGDISAEQEEAIKSLEIAQVYEQYQKLLVEDPRETKLDFGDLILYTIRLLRERKSVLAKYQTQFKFILVDEFQDTNYAQNELVKLLGGEKQNVFVVGDDDQSIYRFRGAAVSNILQFQQDYPKTETVVLNRNYRSTQSILDTSYALIQHNNPDRLEVVAQVNKKLLSADGTGRTPEILHAENLAAETELVARTILDLKEGVNDRKRGSFGVPQDDGREGGTEQMDLFSAARQSDDLEAEDNGLRWSDFAILARANAHLEPFIETLRYYGIPYQVVGSRGLFVREEIRDLISYLRVVIDPDDSLSLFRVLSMEVLHLDGRDLLFALKWAKKQNLSLYGVIDVLGQLRLKPETVERLTSLKAHIEKERRGQAERNPGRVLRDFVREIKLLEYLSGDETMDNITRILNINKLFEKIKDYLSSHEDRTTAGFVDYLELLIEAGDNPATADIDSTSDAVHLMTVHAAKGLEFEVVFTVNLINDRFPTRRRGDTIPLPEEFIRETLPTGDEHIQEERRLFYVAMTRARRQLYLSYSDTYGGVRVRKPSVFLEEALGGQSMLAAPLHGKLDQQAEQGPKEGEFDLHPFLPRLFSYSQLQTFESCPLKYKYSYIYRIPTETGRALVFGQVIHRTLKDFHDGLGKGLPSTLDALLELFEHNWSREGYDSAEEVDQQFARGQDILRRYHAEQHGVFVPSAFLEKGFILKTGQHALTGYIDRIDQLPDGTYEVIDYKTGKMQDLETLEKKVKTDEQLSIYALACRDVLKIEVSRLTLYFIEEGLKASTQRDAAQMEAQEQQIVSIADRIQTSSFEATPDVRTCGFCAYHELCPYSAV
ncbi:hypothetical protein AUK40_00945 [Candidatus Wirthbacteria bacterium CG2_30_54_11]|uniref:DNA 3'-5' helicase n=1 Tax=Candidatus Wirthbacteria bacterium CG2_30_54_11 TaxID=1817892 RepID=A0A1J5IPQ1_9BACT|nr:MAG: hypothetical protein AUK40_00945 [Candidatus Wirthbacteria bacterium CG2_30_54_11]